MHKNEDGRTFYDDEDMMLVEETMEVACPLTDSYVIKSKGTIMTLGEYKKSGIKASFVWPYKEGMESYDWRTTYDPFVHVAEAKRVFGKDWKRMLGL